MTTPEIINHIHEIILEDRRISAKSMDEQLGISREGVRSIIHEDLAMRKLSAKWVPKCLNAEQKRQWCHFSSDAEVIATAETWLDGQPSDFFFFEWLAKVRATG